MLIRRVCVFPRWSGQGHAHRDHSTPSLLSSPLSLLLFSFVLFFWVQYSFQHGHISAFSNMIYSLLVHNWSSQTRRCHLYSTLHGDRHHTFRVWPSFCIIRLVSNKIQPACVAPHVIETEKRNRADYRLPGTDVPTKKMKYVFQWKIKVTIITCIHMISYEYEYFGSARTSVTKSSTRDHIASLFCFIYTRSKCPTHLAKMSFDEILDLTADVF